jgi:DNA (cytosine-5)-methyltransferase 1
MKKNEKERLKPTFVDIFAGCGGLSYGLMKAGWQGLFAIEKDENAFLTLTENLLRPDRPESFAWPEWLPRTAHSVTDALDKYRDNLATLTGKVDMLVGGPPCQGFSSAGRRDANDPRNKLTEAYLRFVELIQPRVVMIENVRGITVDFDSEEEGGQKLNYAKWIIDSLKKEYIVHTKMIDTSAFGVPQKRQRFFIVGVRRDVSQSALGKPFEYIERIRLDHLAKNGIVAPVSARSAISDLEVGRNGKCTSEESKGFDEISYIAPLTAYQRLMNRGVGLSITDTRLARHRPEIAGRFQKLIDLCHIQGRLNISLSKEIKASFGLKKCAIRVMDPDSPSPTITSMPDDLIHYKEPRTLTVRENARLQSFPDSFVFKGKYTTGGDRRKREVPRFTQVANAVPPLMAEAIGVALIQYLNSASSSSVKREIPQQSRKSIRSAQGVLA